MKNTNFVFADKLTSIIKHHYKNCNKYKKILDFLNYNFKKKYKLEDQPFLPINLFKEHDLVSVPKNKIYKTLNSSGTTSNKLSKIYLDRENSYNQVKTLSQIVTKVLGKKRLPMLIIDSLHDVKNKFNLNAKVAAINGFSIFGSNHTYILNENKKINYKLLNIFLNKYADQPFFIFGFTFNVYKNLLKNFNPKLIKKDFSNGILFHGGGWKKMKKLKVNSQHFKEKLKKHINIQSIFNYYGLIEQTGSIFLECPSCNCLTTNEYSEVLIRDKDFQILPPGEKWFIQLLSLLPTSYPGHIILTEDIGEIVENSKKCKICKFNKKFIIHGRHEKSEIRGCSDV